MKISAIATLVLLSFTLLGQSNGKKQVEIGFLLDVRNSEVEPLIGRMLNEIRAVVGEDAEIVFDEKAVLVNDFNLEKAEQNYRQIISGSTDIILAFGAINNVVVSQQKEHAKPTILFGSAPGDFAELDKTRSSSGIPNLAYIITSQSFEVDLEVFAGLHDYKNVGVAVEKAVAETLPFKELLDRIFQEKSATYQLIPFENIDQIIAGLEGTDALYLGGGFLLPDSEIERLAATLIEKGIPSFTATSPEDVALGLMASNQSSQNLDQLFRRISLSVEAVINGAEAGELPLYIENNQTLTLNYNTAERLGVPIKYSGIATTNFVGDFENAVAEKRYNLREIMNEALGNNLSLQSSAKDVDLVGQDLKTARSNYLPDVEASATGTYLDPNLAEVSNGQNPEYSTAANISVSQVLYSPGLSANVKIQQSLKEAQQASLNADQLNTLFDAANAYFNALLLKANLEITARNLDVTKRNLQIAQQNYESGQSGKSDVLRFRSQQAQNTQSLVEAVNQLEQAFISINQLLNQPINRDIDVNEAELGKGIFTEYDYAELRDFLDNPSLREPFVRFLVSQAKKNAPELKSLDFNLDAVDRNLKLATNGRFVPTVALQGQYNYTFNRSGAGADVPMGFGNLPDGYYSLGLNVSLPIFDQNQQNINKQTATIQKEQLSINKDNVSLNLERNVNVAVLQLINQIANIELSKISEEAARESLELTQEAYERGAVNWVELIDSQDNYVSAQLANASAVYNYLLSALQLERYLGQYFLLNTKEQNKAFRQEFFNYLLTQN